MPAPLHMETTAGVPRAQQTLLVRAIIAIWDIAQSILIMLYPQD